MKALPEGLETGALFGPLADGWGFEAATIDYAPVGFGSYHWVAANIEGSRVFVTVDDLDWKPWLGDTRESAFEGLTRAFRSAAALRAAGLEFVVAPLPSTDGDVVHRIGARHSIAVFPFVDGQAGREFDHATAGERAVVLGLLARLHQATPTVASVARSIDLRLPGREQLDSALREVDRAWTGGPLSEPAREALAGHASEVADLLGLFDRLRHAVIGARRPWVVTHGEPHAVNVMRTAEGHALIDWDTVALAPPERDLWMLVRGAGDDATADATAYVEATGHRPDALALDFFRLTWDLADLAAFITVLRAPHRDTEDTRKALAGLGKCVAIRDHVGGPARMTSSPGGDNLGTLWRSDLETCMMRTRRARPRSDGRDHRTGTPDEGLWWMSGGVPTLAAPRTAVATPPRGRSDPREGERHEGISTHRGPRRGCRAVCRARRHRRSTSIPARSGDGHEALGDAGRRGL